MRTVGGASTCSKERSPVWKSSNARPMTPTPWHCFCYPLGCCARSRIWRSGNAALSPARYSGGLMAKFLIVEARFYDHLNDMLVAGARAAIKAAGHKAEVITVPGALEIPGAIALADQTGDYEGYVAIGVVIRGETYHFEIVAGESARGIMALTMDGVAIGNGILTVENEAQAIVRADPNQKDKGGEAAKAALALLDLQQRFGGR